MAAVIYVGVDLGQKRDPTAIVVTEFVEEFTPEDWAKPRARPHPNNPQVIVVSEPEPSRTYYAVRFIERLPLGLSYIAVADRIAEVVRNLRALHPRATVRVVMDATGVGQPVVDLVKNRVADATITGVTITAGDGAERGYNEGRVGKAYLVSRLQVLLQTDRLKLPKTAEGLALAEELLNFEIRVDQDGQDRYGAFRVGTHDDLVVALGLSVLFEPPGRVKYLLDLWG